MCITVVLCSKLALIYTIASARAGYVNLKFTPMFEAPSPHERALFCL
jgi:hypothetical protein